MKEEEAKMGRRKKKKTSDSEDFNISGPKHLAIVDWDNSDDQAAVLASFTQAVYIMQRDKAKKREPLANRWWEFSCFSLDEPLINEADGSIYGAVFKFDFNKNTPHRGVPPDYVIAFRGTMLTFKTVFSDLKQDLRCILTNLKAGKRYGHAKKAIEKVLAKTPDGETTSVWLAGHSLGAAIALSAGKDMARLGSNLKTYAFNPPCPSLPIESMPGSDVPKCVFRLSRSLAEATLVNLTSRTDHQIQEDDTAGWIPYLYVNPADIICAGYIGYSKHKSFMYDYGLSKLQSAADRFSVRRKIFGGQGIHLSSADMIVNQNQSTGSRAANMMYNKTAHGLEQWWKDPANWETQHIRPSI